MYKPLSLAVLAVAAVVAFPVVAPAQASRTKVGTLSCDISGGIGLIITSKKDLTCMFTPSQPGPRQRAGSRRTHQERIPIVEQRADLLVGLDPGRRHAGVAQHPEPERAVPRRRVVVHRQPLTLMRQRIEPALVHRLANLPLDDALPGRPRGQLALAVASLHHHDRMVVAA